MQIMDQFKFHDDFIKWKHFPHYWPLVRGIHRSPVNSPHKGQWHRVLTFSLICAWTNNWVNNRDAGDLRCHCAHYDVTVMRYQFIRENMSMWAIRWPLWADQFQLVIFYWDLPEAILTCIIVIQIPLCFDVCCIFHEGSSKTKLLRVYMLRPLSPME